MLFVVKNALPWFFSWILVDCRSVLTRERFLLQFDLSFCHMLDFYLDCCVEDKLLGSGFYFMHILLFTASHLLSLNVFKKKNLCFRKPILLTCVFFQLLLIRTGGD